MNMHRFKSLAEFYIKSKTKYNVQSPFLYDFVTNVLDTSKEYYKFEKIEKQRSLLLKSRDTVTVQDFGAGSHKLKSDKRNISDIASTSVSPASKCKILFQLVANYHCKNILELGSSLGISTAYIASAHSKARVVSLEGDINISNVATTVLDNLDITNVVIKTGPFSETLDEAIKGLGQIDLAFIDGNHRYEPTIDYFNKIVPFTHNDSIIVVDDIYWSEEMTRTWKEISNHTSATLVIDLYNMGIIFFKKELSREYIQYLPYKLKPWKIGLFG